MEEDQVEEGGAAAEALHLAKQVTVGRSFDRFVVGTTVAMVGSEEGGTKCMSKNQKPIAREVRAERVCHGRPTAARRGERCGVRC